MRTNDLHKGLITLDINREVVAIIIIIRELVNIPFCKMECRVYC